MSNPERAANIIEELREPTEVLFNKHLEVAKIWYPHQLIPEREHDIKQLWTPTIYPLSEGVRSAIKVNLLTEDNLPYYSGDIAKSAPKDHPQQDWGKHWTAEEMRHSIVIRGWAEATGAIDPIELENDRMDQVSRGEVPEFEDMTDLAPYASFQELATKIAHRNTGIKLGKERGGLKVMGTVAGDEGLHEAVYTGLTASAIEIDPDYMVMQIGKRVRSFAMPGTGINNYDTHSKAISKEGIFGANEMLHDVIEPKLLEWDYWNIPNLSDEAEIARDGVARRLKSWGRIATAEQAIREEYQASLVA